MTGRRMIYGILAGIMLLNAAPARMEQAVPEETAAPVLSMEEDRSILEADTFEVLPEKGFLVPIPAGEAWIGGANRGSMGLFAETYSLDAFGWLRTMRYYHRSLDTFVTSDNPAEFYYNQFNFDGERNVMSETVDIDGHPARLITFSYDRSEGQFGAHGGMLLYAREMQLLQIRIYSENFEKTEEDIPRVTMETMRQLASMIRYDYAQAPIRHADVEMTIEEENHACAVTAGKSLKLSAVFGNREIVNAKKGNNEVIWEVRDVSTGEESVNAEISAGGTLTVHRGVEGPVKLLVRAESTVFHTTAEYAVTIVNGAEELSLVSDPISFYAGTDASAVLTAKILPVDLLQYGLQWTLSKPDVVSLTPAEDGTAVIRPLKAGKVTVCVKEPGGKTAEMPLTVLEPVREIKLSAKGRTKPGSTVKLTAKVLPETADNRKVTWSVNVDKSIATINKKGSLKIRKAAEPGTVIVVTCRAEGAPEPVTATIEITVDGVKKEEPTHEPEDEGKK